MIKIRAERLIAGDVILHGDDHRTSSPRATAERDRVFQAILLV